MRHEQRLERRRVVSLPRPTHRTGLCLTSSNAMRARCAVKKAAGDDICVCAASRVPRTRFRVQPSRLGAPERACECVVCVRTLCYTSPLLRAPYVGSQGLLLAASRTCVQARVRVWQEQNRRWEGATQTAPATLATPAPTARGTTMAYTACTSGRPILELSRSCV